MKSEISNQQKELLERTLTEYPQAGGHITINGREFLNFSSNDYLDLARRPELTAAAKAAVDKYGTGSTSSRLVAGTLPCHTELENRLANYKGYPSALVFGSGYMTNAGVISSLVSRNDHVFVDRLVHASIIDAAILSRAHLHRFSHNDPAHLSRLLESCGEDGTRMVVTESVFSMDGDVAPLAAIAEAADRNNAILMVDEAHATGVLGPHGSGLVRGLGLTERVTVSMGTLSKAMGSYGGFVACSEATRSLLVNRARSFIYTTAPPPSSMAAATAALDILERDQEPGPDLIEKADLFRAVLQEAGLDTGTSTSQIVPVIIGNIARTMTASSRLRDLGIIAVPIRPPTVPEGTSRLRFSITLAHSQADLTRAARATIETIQQAS